VRGAEGNSSNTTVQVSLSKNQNGKINGGTIDLYSTKEDGQRVSEDGFPKTISEAVAGIAGRWKSVDGNLFPPAEERLEIIKKWFPGDKKLQEVNKLEVVEKKKEEEAARIAREKVERDAIAERSSSAKRGRRKRRSKKSSRT
jgi:hypothetical protein